MFVLGKGHPTNGPLRFLLLEKHKGAKAGRTFGKAFLKIHRYGVMKGFSHIQLEIHAV